MKRFLLLAAVATVFSAMTLSSSAFALERSAGRGLAVSSGPSTSEQRPAENDDASRPDESPDRRPAAQGRSLGTPPSLSAPNNKMSLNSNTGEAGFKKELKDSKFRNTSDDARNQANQASKGLGHDEQIDGLTKTSKENQETLAATLEKKKALEKHQAQCRERCADGELGPSLFDTVSPYNGYKSPVPSIDFTPDTEEEKKAEEEAKAAAKAEEEKKAKMTMKEKVDACYQDCLKQGTFSLPTSFGGNK